ncbi:MAG: hypothetical protein V8Q84_03330 [Bilophila sp.]
MTLKKLGIEVTFVDPGVPKARFRRPSGPTPRRVGDHRPPEPCSTSRNSPTSRPPPNGAPHHRIADARLAALLSFGADIVIHSTTEYIDGHVLQMGR